MTKNLNAYAIAHGYQIIKTRKCKYIPILNRYIWLPLWFAYEPEYLSKKRSRYTLDGLIFKLMLKADRKRNKRATQRQEKLIKQLQTA